MNIKATNLSIKMNSNIKQHIVGIPDSKSKSHSNKKIDLPIVNVEKSATVDISKDGRELAKKLREDKRKEIQINIEETWKKIGEADKLSSKIESGEELTDIEKEFINDNLQKITSERYVYNKTHIITRDEFEGALKTLKENFEARLNMYADMQKRLDAQGLADELNKNAQFIAKAKQDENEKQRIIDILKETLDADDEDEEEENKKTESDENQDENAGGSSGRYEALYYEFKTSDVKNVEFSFGAAEVVMIPGKKFSVETARRPARKSTRKG